MNSSLAKNYAEAIFSICLDNNNLLDIQSEMKDLKQIIIENDGFISVLSNYFSSLEEKEEIVDKTLTAFDENIKSLIKVMCKNHRANLLVDVIDEFNSLANESRGIMEGLVYSVYPLTKEQLKSIENKISEIEKVPCELKNMVDSNLIGGVKVAINGHIYDGSIKNKIESMRLSLNK